MIRARLRTYFTRIIGTLLKIRHVRGAATDISRRLRISGLLSAGAVKSLLLSKTAREDFQGVVRKQQADSGVRSAALDFKIHMAVNKIGRDSLQMKSGIGDRTVLYQGQVPRQFLGACSLWISSKRNLTKTEPCMNQTGVDTKALHIPIVLRGTNRHQSRYAQLLGFCGGGSAVPLIRRPHSIGWVGTRQATINHKRYAQPVVSMNRLTLDLENVASPAECSIIKGSESEHGSIHTSFESKFPDKSKSPLFLPNPKTRSLGTDNEMDQEPACSKDQVQVASIINRHRTQSLNLCEYSDHKASDSEADDLYRRKLPGIPLCGVEPGIRASTNGARSEEYVQERILKSMVLKT
ncbi:hypothetical protein EDD85DRAFT_932132 [Armillaria nabsnona]|nr:hypothetical protein EDD85DRAFT_932132 [Armillaria nabsnona]